MARLPDWEARLSAVLAEWSTRRFRWDGDCARFAAATVIAVTGEDPLADLRGRYRTRREAMAILEEKPMEARLDAMFPRVPIGLAQRGDIALLDAMALGCVIGGDARGFGPDGVMDLMPRAEWLGAWGVGRDG